MYPDQNWKEMCGMLANLVADSGAGKGRKDFAEYYVSALAKNKLGGQEKRAWRVWEGTGLEAMEKQAWRAWRNRPGGYGEMT